MDHLYAIGACCIEGIQDWFEEDEWYFTLINNMTTPSYTLEVLFPLVASFDTVFAAELCLTCAFGGWLNSILKWWFQEDRPYWWVQETDYFKHSRCRRPVLRQNAQTCESGPGSPSGHSQTTGAILMLFVMWILHFMSDRKCYVWWWKWVTAVVFLWILGSVMMARMYVAAHFPHQVVFGALLGMFIGSAISLHVVDPYIYRTGVHAYRPISYSRFWFMVSLIIMIAMSIFTYISFEIAGWDEKYSRAMAEKWCKNPKAMSDWKLPMYSLAMFTGHMFGWVLVVTPEVAQYRHFTRNRSLEVAIATTGMSMYLYSFLKKKNKVKLNWVNYSIIFLLAAMKTVLLLKVVPLAARLPFWTHDRECLAFGRAKKTRNKKSHTLHQKPK